jgi:hypothetical protein
VLEALEDWVDVVRIDGNQPPDAVTREILDRLQVRDHVQAGAVGAG